MTGDQVLVFSRPYRTTAEVLKFEGNDLTKRPYEKVRIVTWHETNGAVIEDESRIAALEANLAESQGDAYVPR